MGEQGFFPGQCHDFPNVQKSVRILFDRIDRIQRINRITP
jgi:hypothetical protein